jgi:hypothetical protein
MNTQPDTGMKEVVLSQLALNTADMSGTLSLYYELFGFANAGGNALWGDVMRVQGLEPDAHGMMWWIVGGTPFFQIELFHHGKPKQKPQPKDWRPSDHGWVRFGVAVDDYDRVVSGLKRLSITVLGTAGRNGQRRLAFRDPYAGVIVEVMEGAAAACPAVVYATSSVPDIAKARHLYENVAGAEIEPLDLLHKPEDESMWGLKNAQREGFLVRLGDAFLEILSYSSPAGRPRPADHCIVDQGIMNIGLGSRNKSAIRALIGRIQAAGLKTTVVMDSVGTIGTYVIEPGFEHEPLSVPRELDAQYGFARTGPFLAEFGLRPE